MTDVADRLCIRLCISSLKALLLGKTSTHYYGPLIFNPWLHFAFDSMHRWWVWIRISQQSVYNKAGWGERRKLSSWHCESNSYRVRHMSDPVGRQLLHTCRRWVFIIFTLHPIYVYCRYYIHISLLTSYKAECIDLFFCW